MRKEIIFAILAGGSLGAIIAFGIWRANSAIQNTPQIEDTFAPQETRSPSSSFGPNATPSGGFGITLAKPDSDDVETQSPVTFTGITQPSTWVVISTDKSDYTFLSAADGSFSQDVKLSPGINQIVLTAFNEKGNSVTKTLNLVYSKELAQQQ
ncbi:hypothetical protein HY045_01445 [Candidatus Woesebacteria bacterium]|nr:hypothetical protein [Candidatus Woesebacteria bacterium]